MLKRLLGISLVFLTVSCNSNSSQNKFLLAERLHEDKKYDAAIHEYQEVIDKEPFSKLGLRALLKIAQTQHLYLGRTSDAQASYRLYLKRIKDESEKTEILKILAKLAFEEFEDYGEAVTLYKELLKRGAMAKEAEEYYFQIGRAYFLSNKFAEAIASFEEQRQRYPNGDLAKKAELEIANALSASNRCREAIAAYEKVKSSSDKELAAVASFSQAICYEELDDLDKAFELLESIRLTYPSPKLVELKMSKIKRRKILRKR